MSKFLEDQINVTCYVRDKIEVIFLWKTKMITFVSLGTKMDVKKIIEKGIQLNENTEYINLMHNSIYPIQSSVFVTSNGTRRNRTMLIFFEGKKE